MTGLRTIWGVDLNKIESDFGIIYKTQLLKQAEKHIRQGTLEIILAKKTSILKITQKGLFLSDGIAADLFVL